jgi:cytochrome c biogenesis protein CcdA
VLEISYLAAFFGGILSLLSPCSALLLPAFFAYAFQSRKDLLTKTAIFYLGLLPPRSCLWGWESLP